jgi:hypothetical protein
MAYGSTVGVGYLVPAMGRLSASSQPVNTTMLTAWLAEGSSVIDRHLAGAGYAVPVLSGTTVYAELTGLANQYAAAYAIRARGLDVISGENEDRATVWLNEFYARLAALAASTLADVPTSGGGTVTGRRMRFTQLKRVDAYSAIHDDDTDMDS